MSEQTLDHSVFRVPMVKFSPSALIYADAAVWRDSIGRQCNEACRNQPFLKSITVCIHCLFGCNYSPSRIIKCRIFKFLKKRHRNLRTIWSAEPRRSRFMTFDRAIALPDLSCKFLGDMQRAIRATCVTKLRCVIFAKGFRNFRPQPAVSLDLQTNCPLSSKGIGVVLGYPDLGGRNSVNLQTASSRNMETLTT
jgi:hypothetical protein